MQPAACCVTVYVVLPCGFVAMCAVEGGVRGGGVQWGGGQCAQCLLLLLPTILSSPVVPAPNPLSPAGAAAAHQGGGATSKSARSKTVGAVKGEGRTHACRHTTALPHLTRAHRHTHTDALTPAPIAASPYGHATPTPAPQSPQSPFKMSANDVRNML